MAIIINKKDTKGGKGGPPPHIAAILGIGPSEDEPSEEADRHEARKAMAHDLLKAVHSHDAEGVIMAIDALVQSSPAEEEEAQEAE